MIEMHVFGMRMLPVLWWNELIWRHI